jgi:hypothetical protein
MPGLEARLAALEAALLPDDADPLDSAFTVFLVDVVTGKRTYECACCEPFVSLAVANTKAYLTVDPSEWEFVPQKPKPPMPEHLVRQLQEGSL